jgi:eukaryotic-like serine/threonine-protein kinase
MLGTPAFMAPEQARGQSKEVDGQTDVWAVGATVFALLSGHLVHEADSATMLLLKVATTPARSLTRVAKDVPEPIAALVDKALAFEKASRWESAAAMRDALEEAYAATVHEPLTREVLAAYFREMEEAPLRSTPAPDPAAGAPPSTTPLPDSRSLVATKVEGKGAPMPDGGGERGVSLPPVSPLALTSVLPPSVAPTLGSTPSGVPPAPAPETPRAVTKSESASTLPPGPLAASPLARRRSMLPLLVGALIVLGLLLGIAAMLSGRAPATP